MLSAPEQGARFRRQRAELAIRLAMQSRWEEAVAANRSIVQLFPDDVDAYNRLGKAQTELGRYDHAREAYNRALQLDPANVIAKKNLIRLAGLKAAPRTGAAVATKVDPRLFIEETGKTAVVLLANVAKDILAKVGAGDQLQLKAQDKLLYGTTMGGEYLGQVEPKLGLRLIGLMAGGNRYEAAVTSATDQHVKIIIREAYQAPAMAGRLSFPPRADTSFRPYIKESVLRYGLEGEGLSEEGDDDGGEWEEEEEEGQEEGGFIAQSLSEESDDADEEEES